MFFNLNNFGYFNLIVDNFFYRNVSWYFPNDLNNSLNNCFMRNNSLLYCFELDQFIDYFLHNSVYFYINVLFNNNFLNSSLHNWNLHNFLNFLDSLLDHNFRNNSFNYLRNFDYLLDNTRYNYNFLNYLFNFYNFWYLNHLLNDLLYWNFDLFNTVNMSQDLNYFLLDVFDWFRYLDVMINNFLDLYSLRFSHN